MGEGEKCAMSDVDDRKCVKWRMMMMWEGKRECACVRGYEREEEKGKGVQDELFALARNSLRNALQRTECVQCMYGCVMLLTQLSDFVCCLLFVDCYLLFVDR
jgi:hypothetical protein